jgi:hypothetical protein
MPCWPMSQYHSDSARHSPRTRQLLQTAMAAAASRRALSGVTLTGNHSSGSRLLSVHRAYLATRVHRPWPVTGLGAGCAGRLLAMCGITSADNAPAAAHQRGDLVRAGTIGGGLG